MPVRARSRTSKSSRNASQFWVMPRSSSKSASKPEAITPPSRSSTEGSAAMAALSNASICASGLSASLSMSSSRAWFSGTSDLSAGSVAKVLRSPVSSRGRTWRSAMRAVMRSTSLMLLNKSRSASVGWFSSTSMASCRCVATCRARSGCVIQWRSARLPMPVRQVSSSDSKVGESSPRRVCVNSKLRCEEGGRSSKSVARCTCSVRTCASAWPWVCSA